MDRRDFMALMGLAGAGVSLNRLWALGGSGLSEAALGMGPLSFDKHSLLINGARKDIFSAEFHYYRHPSPSQWEARVKKLKQSGFNTICTYYYWAYHSPAQGRYDFKDSRDIDLFHQIVADNGMYLIARPGPYICAEVDGGGFPGWLLAKRQLNLRCRRNAKPAYDPEYMKYVREWYEQVLPRINAAKSLILLQIENEYGFYMTPSGLLAQAQGALSRRYGGDVFVRLGENPALRALYQGDPAKAMKSKNYAAHSQYMQELYKMARELGVKVPLFHNDAGSPSQRFVDVDIPGADNYPIGNFRDDWKHDNPFAAIDLFEAQRDAIGSGFPMLAPEIQGGWYDPWGGPGYDQVRKILGPLAMDMTLKSCLAQGTSILSIYMACGGTTWGYTGEPEVYTSYDYGAPITEGGRISERAEACRLFSEFVAAHEQSILKADPEPQSAQAPKDVFVKVRKNPAGERFVFLRNLTGKGARVSLDFGEFEINYPGFDVLMLDKSGKVADKLATVGEVKAEPMVYIDRKPALKDFSFSVYDAPFNPASGLQWKKVPPELDLEALEFYYGYAWYRARTGKRVKWLKADARHFWALYVNGEFVQVFNNFRNLVGVGDDVAKSFRAWIPKALLQEENELVILVESLGHNKGFMEDSHNPRGLVSVETDAGPLEWEAVPGLVQGDTGITPRVDFSRIIPASAARIGLPHKAAAKGGLGVYSTRFDLDLEIPDRPAIGVKISRCSGKANIYINGWLIGRYWDEVGPQKHFYLPPGLLNINGSNELTIVVWPWGKEIALGEMELSEYA